MKKFVGRSKALGSRSAAGKCSVAERKNTPGSNNGERKNSNASLKKPGWWRWKWPMKCGGCSNRTERGRGGSNSWICWGGQVLGVKSSTSSSDRKCIPKKHCSPAPRKCSYRSASPSDKSSSSRKSHDLHLIPSIHSSICLYDLAINLCLELHGWIIIIDVTEGLRAGSQARYACDDWGEGAYSEVFRVERRADHKVYALKKVKLANLSEKEIENALNEVRILASLKNNSIVGYKEVFL